MRSFPGRARARIAATPTAPRRFWPGTSRVGYPHHTHFIGQTPDIWLLLDQNTPEEITVEWQATAKEATGRLSGTIEVPASSEFMTTAALMADPPESG
jgi:hypothetical protein